MRIPKIIRKTQSGIALFMVLTTISIIIVVVAQLTYSTQVQSRIAYNYVDGLKSYYSAKAAFKVGMLRLSLYKQVKDLMAKEENKAMAGLLGPGFIEKIWNFPFMYPIPLAEEATMVQKEEIAKFHKESNLEGTYQLNITSEGSRLNINNLLVKTPPAQPSPSPSNSPGVRPPTPNPSPSISEVDARPVFEEAIAKMLSNRGLSDREFAETYRNITAKDIVEGLIAYMKLPQEANVRPNLPGIADLIPKAAPLYSMTELHYIPGIDDNLYNLIEPSFTTFSTPGINVNAASKNTIWSLIPELTEDDIKIVMEKRDEPTTGKPFESEDKFWEAVKTTSIGESGVNTVKERLQKAGLRIITTEESFHIQAMAQVGLATRTIDAWVIFDTARQNQPNQQGRTAAPQQQQQPNQQNTTNEKQKQLRLIYWRHY